MYRVADMRVQVIERSTFVYVIFSFNEFTIVAVRGTASIADAIIDIKIAKI